MASHACDECEGGNREVARAHARNNHSASTAADLRIWRGKMKRMMWKTHVLPVSCAAALKACTSSLAAGAAGTAHNS